MKYLAKVYLVGSGPSSLDLLTLRAKRLIERADVIIYDALVDNTIHRIFPQGAKLYDVGKRAGKHALTQDEINSLLISVAQSEGGNIVRLKGGDPFVFGRGGEEMQALHKAGIPYEVVPGVTAGIAVPAYFGVPVTQRALSRSVTLVTAFTKDGGLPDLDWNAYAHLDGTVVFYMSMRVVPLIAKALIEAGCLPSRRAAIMSEGTRPNQRIELGDLNRFTSESIDYESYTPGIFVVGDVLAFAEQYQWYSSPKLSGQRILITRSEGQTSELTDLLEAEGAEVRVLPTFTIRQESSDKIQLDLDYYRQRTAVLALTSPNAVHSLMHYLFEIGLDARALSAFNTIAVVGPATAKVLTEYGLRSDLIATVHTAEGLATEIAELHPQAVFLPTSNLGGDILKQALTQREIDVRTECIYRNEPVNYSTEELRAELESVDWITFCSSSAANNFYRLLSDHGLSEVAHSVRMAAIGPSTATTLQGLGWTVSAEPQIPRLDALVQEICSVSSREK